MEAKSICKVDFGYILTFFGAEVGLVANKFWGKVGCWLSILAELLMIQTCGKTRVSVELQRQVKAPLIVHQKEVQN